MQQLRLKFFRAIFSKFFLEHGMNILLHPSQNANACMAIIIFSQLFNHNNDKVILSEGWILAIHIIRLKYYNISKYWPYYFTN